MKDQKAHREKIRQGLIGRKLSDTHKANISEAMKGKCHSDNHRKNISEGMKKYWAETNDVKAA